MHPKRQSVKLTTVQLPFLCFAVERRVKNKFCLLLTEKESSVKFLLRKENVSRMVCTILLNHGRTQTPRPGESSLFDFDLRTSGLDLLLDLIRFLLCHAFLDCLWGAFDKRLCFSQAQSRHRAANFLNHSNLVRAHFFQDHVERGFLFRCRSCRSARCTAGG